MHAYSRAQRRRRVEPVSAEQYMRFLVQWHHVTGATQHSGPLGLARVIGQLQGYETAVGAFRADLPWLLAAHRGDATPPVPGCGAVAEVVEVLADRGACFAGELARATGRVLADVEAALWEGMARGLLVSDGFEPVRAVASGRRRAPADAPRRARLRSGGLRPTETAGRWSLVPPAATDIDPDDLAEALADQLLERWGVVFYDLVATERTAVRWRDLQWALRRMEDRGLVAGGRFVRGFTGEQFALPQAAEALQGIRRTEPSGRTVRLSGADPLNLTNVVVPGTRVPARATEWFDLPL
jgi:ATP-dependent Lhr-like helicase